MHTNTHTHICGLKTICISAKKKCFFHIQFASNCGKYLNLFYIKVMWHSRETSFLFSVYFIFSCSITHTHSISCPLLFFSSSLFLSISLSLSPAFRLERTKLHTNQKQKIIDVSSYMETIAHQHSLMLP